MVLHDFSWVRIVLAAHPAGEPVVLSQVMSHNSAAWMSSRVSSSAAAGGGGSFFVQLKTDTVAATAVAVQSEMVGWVASAPGQRHFGGLAFEAGTAGLGSLAAETAYTVPLVRGPNSRPGAPAPTPAI